MADLFDFAEYPQRPGWKRQDTSAEAAEAVASAAPILRARCLAALERSDGLTADELAERIGFPILSVRPRVSELVNMGKVARKAGVRRQSSSGHSSAVWVVVPRRPAANDGAGDMAA
jgi:predicted ArsR family transcriptional regulator